MDPVVPFARGQRPPTYAELERLSDDQLMARLQAGCNDALAVLFDRYHRLVYSIALKIIRDSGEAEDVMQSVFFDIFRAMAQFDPSKGTTKVWMLQYAYHRAISRRQYLNARSFYTQEDLEGIEGVLPQRDSPLGKFTPGELKHLIRGGLATLSSAQQRVIELASHEGLSMKEIADKTGESLVNVRHHYYRGLRKLRTFVERPAKVRKAAGDE
jgi:RNA polymerase sigma-70 factor, ECF subfamily